MAQRTAQIHFKDRHAGLLQETARSGTRFVYDPAWQTPAKEIEANLAAHVTPLIAALYDRFGVSGLSAQQVAAEVERFKQTRT